MGRDWFTFEPPSSDVGLTQPINYARAIFVSRDGASVGAGF
jgi:hypothetical protein